MKKTFNKIQPRKLVSKTVEDEILKSIKSRKFIAGEKLPTQFELCEQFGVSRTTIRDALRGLEAKGFITIKKVKGTFINELTLDLVSDHLDNFLQIQNISSALEVIRARQIIEPELAAVAAKKHTKEDAKKLEEDHKNLINCDNDYTNLSKFDLTFHLDIAKASGNIIVPLLLEPIHKLMPKIKSQVYATIKDAKESAIIWHEKILNAILNRNIDEARNAMTKHLEIAEEHVLRSLGAKK